MFRVPGRVLLVMLVGIQKSGRAEVPEVRAYRTRTTLVPLPLVPLVPVLGKVLVLLHLLVGFDVRVVEVRLEHDDTVRQHIRRVGGGEDAAVVDAEAFGELFHNAIDLLGFPWDPESTDARGRRRRRRRRYNLR